MINNHLILCCILALLPQLCVAGTVVAKPTEASAFPSNGAVTGSPDEGILWALFHSGKITVLRQQIADLQQRFPNWKAPADLLNALQSVKNPSKSQATLQSKKPYKKTFSTLDRKWKQAALYAQTQKPNLAQSLYRTLVTFCTDPDVKRQTLINAGIQLPHPEFLALIDFAERFLTAETLSTIQFEVIKHNYLQNPPLSLSELNRIIDTVTDPLQAYLTTDFASSVAWRFFDFHDFDNAYKWFALADQLNPNQISPSLGTFLALEKLAAYDQLLALYAKIQNPELQLRAIASRAYKAKAWQQFNSEDFAESQQSVDKAEGLTGSDYASQELNAWLANQDKNHAKAAYLFETLYRQSPRSEFAAAYVQNQTLANPDILDSKLIQYGGAIFSEYNKSTSDALYSRKQFLAANELSPSRYPALEHIHSDSIDFSSYGRSKSGAPGLSQLEILKAPVFSFSHTATGGHLFKFSLSRIDLNAGTVDREGPTNHMLSNGIETEFLYRKEGWFSPYLRLANTPSNGVISPTIAFDTGFVQQTRFGNWGFSLYAQPVRQSILSYTGARDAQGHEWGRVLRTGLKTHAYYRLNDEWGISGSADLALLKGVDVNNNAAFAFSTGFSRNLNLPGFDYFNIGPSILFEHYAKNLSQFSVGHGGYFSPDQYFNLGFGVQFLTDEGRAFIIKGHAIAGFQSSKLESPPIHNTTNTTPSSTSGDALDLEAKGVWLVTPHLQLGAGIGIRHANSYEDYTGGLFIRYFFEDRKASFSSDLQESQFDNMRIY